MQAGRGLAAAHGVGLVHRDFKPDNVMIDHDGRVSVMDFGLVVSKEPYAAAQTAPLSRRVAGTLMYMPPEALRGAPADARGDQYAFCVALYEALYGRPPFHNPSKPARVHDAVARGLHASAAERHSSMRSLLAALERSVTKAPPGRRLWRGLAVAALVVVGLVFGASWSGESVGRAAALDVISMDVSSITFDLPSVAPAVSSMEPASQKRPPAPAPTPTTPASRIDCTRPCALDGQCTVSHGSCVVGSSADCRRSRLCSDLGRCTAVGGRCSLTSDADCAMSVACRHHQYCPSDRRTRRCKK